MIIAHLIVLSVANTEQEEENTKLLSLFVVSRGLKVMLKAINILQLLVKRLYRSLNAQ